MDPTGVKVLETAEDIQERRQQVLDRYHRFKELSTLRRQKLEDSYRFQFFQRDADELEKWIQEKLQIASDENYKDPSNLQVKKGSFFRVPPGGRGIRESGVRMTPALYFSRGNCKSTRPLKLKCRLTPEPSSSWMRQGTK